MKRKYFPPAYIYFFFLQTRPDRIYRFVFDFPTKVERGERCTADRPKFFQTISSCTVGKTTQARLHYKDSPVDLPPVLQGNSAVSLI